LNQGLTHQAFTQDEDSRGKLLAGIGITCLTALGFVYGFQDDNTEALRQSRNLLPLTETYNVANEGLKQQKFGVETFPTTLVSGELPVGELSVYLYNVTMHTSYTSYTACFNVQERVNSVHPLVEVTSRMNISISILVQLSDSCPGVPGCERLQRCLPSTTLQGSQSQKTIERKVVLIINILLAS
jgi:hypothetical protein